MSSNAPPSRRAFRIGLGEATGAIADIGILVPLSAALILKDGMDAGAIALCAGLLYLGAGLWFRIPFPVQPLKALTAVAVAEQLGPGVIRAAGIELGLILLLLSLARAADHLARIFLKPVIRALQVGVGILLFVAAIKLVKSPPDVSRGVPSTPWLAALAAATFIFVALAVRLRRHWVALVALAAGVLATVAVAHPDLAPPALSLPTLGLPGLSAFSTAFFLLVVPQLPLTFGNAVVATNDLAHEEFGPAAERVTPARICLSDGLANVAAGLIGGMPMCHGSGGLTAHIKLGARTAGMNLVLGGTFIVTGLFFARDVPALLGVLPVWVLAAFLAYAGMRHAWLAADLRGWSLAIALIAGILGAWFGNLAITAVVALPGAHALAFAHRRKPSPAGNLAG